MLDSANKYRCLDMTGLESFVTGGIMPVRDLRKDGSWRALKYEDMLFLAEAKRERQHWKALPAERYSPPGRILNDLHAKNAWIHENISGEYINPHTSDGKVYISRESVLPQGLVSAATIGDAITGKEITFEESGAGATWRSKLGAEEIRKAYRNVKKMGRTIWSVGLGDIVESVTETGIYVRSDGSQSTPTQRTYTPAYYAQLYAKSHSGYYGTSWTFSSLSYKAQVAAYPFAKEAWLLLRFETDRWSTPTSTYGEVAAFKCAVNDGVISAPGLDLLSYASDLCGMHGIEYANSPTYSENATGMINLVDAALVVDHEFPAEIDSVEGWNGLANGI